MQVQINGTEFVETDDLDLRELKDLKIATDTIIDMIEHQLEMANAELAEDGRPIDRKWKATARFALTRKKRAATLLAEAIGERKRAEKSRGRSVADFAVDILKERLSQQEFEFLVSQAENRRIAALAEEDAK